MTGFRTPPQADFHSYAALLGAQGGHFGTLDRWCGQQCADTKGLDGLLYPVRGVVTEFSGYFAEKTAQCGRGMALVSSKIQQTSAAYTGTDRDIGAGLARLYPTAISGFPDLSAIPGASRLGDYTDEDVTLTEPASGADDTAKNISHQLLTIRDGFKSGVLGTAEKVFQYFTGQSLVGLLLDPLVGDFGQLKYLHDVYDEMGDGLYTVAGTLRKGSWALGSEWTGQAATAFDSYLFGWSMGVGGLGDAAKVVAKVYKDGFDAVVLLVQAALREMEHLLVQVLPKLAADGAEIIEGDAAIEAIGGGPEDPVADVVAGVFTAAKLYQVYKDISLAITIINTVEGIFNAINKALAAIESGVQAVVKMINSPMPTLGSLIDDVEQRGFTFEKGAWDPTLGAVRVGMLPSA